MGNNKEVYLKEFEPISIFEELVIGSNIENILRSSICVVLHEVSNDEIYGGDISVKDIYERLVINITQNNIDYELDSSKLSIIARNINEIKQRYIEWYILNKFIIFKPVSFSGIYLKYMSD